MINGGYCNSVEVKLVTWNKDSHGLFDYESRSVDLKFIRAETSCEIYRLSKRCLASLSGLIVGGYIGVEKDPTAPDAQKEEFRLLDAPVDIPNKENLTSINSIFLASIENCGDNGIASQGKFSFNAFRDSLRTLQDNQLAQEPYLIVRSLKNDQNQQKGYDLMIGDVVKFGRIEYQVVQLKDQRGDPQIRYIEKQVYNQGETITIESETARTCKICLGEDESEENFFCNPCKCKGSCEFVHFECLKNWIQSKLKCKQQNTTSFYSWKKSDCELCKQPLPRHINYHNNLHNLIDLNIPLDKPYIVLESIAKEKKVVKTLFVFSAPTEDSEIKLGRGHQCEVRISDISVSRTHSFIKYQKGRFTIFDNNSKFGTLIKMSKEIEINNEKKAVQIGRTVITFALKMGGLLGYNQLQDKTEQKPVSSKDASQQLILPSIDGSSSGTAKSNLSTTQVSGSQTTQVFPSNIQDNSSSNMNNINNQPFGNFYGPNGYYTQNNFQLNQNPLYQFNDQPQSFQMPPLQPQLQTQPQLQPSQQQNQQARLQQQPLQQMPQSQPQNRNGSYKDFQKF